MSTFTDEQYSLMKDKLSQAVKDFGYRLKRYAINYSIVIGHTFNKDVDLSKVSNYIRETDRFITLNHATFAVIFDCTNEITGVQAAHNLLTNFHDGVSSQPLYLTIVTAGNYEADPKMMHELFSLLDYAIEHNMNNIILEHSQVIQKL